MTTGDRDINGPGLGEDVDDGPVLKSMVFNFDVDKTRVKQGHKAHLKSRVVPFMSTDSSATAMVWGRASRTGNEENNRKLSLGRAEHVIQFLHGEGVPLTRLIAQPPLGSENAREMGEAARERAVDVWITKDPRPFVAADVPTVELASDQTLEVLKRAPPHPEELDGVTRTAMFGPFGESKVRFKIHLAKPTSKTRILVRSADADEHLADVEFTSGDMVTPGDKIWEWDGYDKQGVLDSRKIRGILFVYVLTDQGRGDARIWCPYIATKQPSFAEVKVDRTAKRVDVTTFVMILKYGTPEADNFVTPPVGRSAPTDAEFATAKANILEGLAKHWSRNGTRRFGKDITAGGSYQVFTRGEEAKNRGVPFVVLHLLVTKRSCNLGVVNPGWPVLFIPSKAKKPDAWSEEQARHSDRHTGGHEFGHSVLLDGWGFHWSLTHKGSSHEDQDTISDWTSEDKNWDSPAPPAEIDLMAYYKDKDGGVVDLWDRNVATETDVKALIGSVRIRFEVPTARR